MVFIESTRHRDSYENILRLRHLLKEYFTNKWKVCRGHSIFQIIKYMLVLLKSSSTT